MRKRLFEVELLLALRLSALGLWWAGAVKRRYGKLSGQQSPSGVLNEGRDHQ